MQVQNCDHRDKHITANLYDNQHISSRTFSRKIKFPEFSLTTIYLPDFSRSVGTLLEAFGSGLKSFLNNDIWKLLNQLSQSLMPGRPHSPSYISTTYVHAWEVSKLLYLYLDMTGTKELVNKMTDPDVFLDMTNTSPVKLGPEM